MKLSFKTTTLIAAIGMIVYTIYVLTRYVLGEYFGIHYVFNLATEIRIRLIYDILPLSMVVACCGLWKYRPAENASKAFRVFTICLFVALIGTLLFSPLYTVYIAGMKHIYPSICWRTIMLISGIVWLFMLRHQPLEDASLRSYQVTLIVAMLALAFPIFLEIASGISCLCSGFVLSLSSDSIQSWVNYIAPIMILTHFVFPQLKTINTTRNSHCTPNSDAERTFKRNRMITLVLVGVTIISGIVGMAIFHGVICHEVAFLKYEYLKQYTILHNIGVTSLSVMAFTLLSSYIMLSIMAFRQLPNLRGYKIYNTVCQIITWGSFGVTFLAPNGIDEIFITIFLVSFCAFFITTTIRVISYSLPKQLEQ